MLMVYGGGSDLTRLMGTRQQRDYSRYGVVGDYTMDGTTWWPYRRLQRRSYKQQHRAGVCMQLSYTHVQYSCGRDGTEA